MPDTMNREVHYIFSIQTQDYLKSACERERRVYLMISPIAQCRADASGNFREAVARGDRTAVSCLSNLANTESSSKGKQGTTTAKVRVVLAVPVLKPFTQSGCNTFTRTNVQTHIHSQVLHDLITGFI